ncbi:MAG: hypothetical protein AB7O56_09280 [Bauldia sp.]
MTRATRIALLFLAVVIVALTVFTYPTVWGFISLMVRTLAILGGLFVLALLIAGTFKRKPAAPAFLIILAAIGVVGTAYPQISTTLDANRFNDELAAAGPENVFDVIAASETRAGTLTRESYAIADRTNAEIEALVEAADDPSLDGLFDTTRMLDQAALLNAEAVTTAFREGAQALYDRIDTMKLAEVDAVDAIETTLPDSARLLFLDAVRQRAMAERDFYRAPAAQAVALNEVHAELVAMLVARSPNFNFDDATQRPAFTDPADAERYAALLAQIEPIRAEMVRLREEFAPTRVPAALAIVEAIGAKP